eukprot:2722530-Amphidinium_carterae.1
MGVLAAFHADMKAFRALRPAVTTTQHEKNQMRFCVLGSWGERPTNSRGILGALASKAPLTKR